MPRDSLPQQRTGRFCRSLTCLSQTCLIQILRSPACLAFGMLLAWLAILARKQAPPRKALAGLATMLALLQLASLIFGLRAE
jgi:hypothetical protein